MGYVFCLIIGAAIGIAVMALLQAADEKECYLSEDEESFEE